MSKPPKTDHRQSELFRNRLSSQLNPHHPLMMLEKQIRWDVFETAFSSLYVAEAGHPPKPIRLMVGLVMLQHKEGLSDEQAVAKWVENPYWQYFCGYDYLQWDFPIHPSSLTRWRQRLGEKGIEKILQETIHTALVSGTVQEKDLEKVIADTTVMEKAIAHPTDSKLLAKALEKLVSMAKKEGLVLRQTYKRVGKKALIMAGRYGHAGQFKRMKKQVKKLKIYVGRVVRDMERKIVDSQSVSQKLTETLELAKRLLTQKKESKNKLYSLHEPAVECIGKGKANKRYEFGCKVSLAVTHKQGLVVSSQALHGNPYDGHTLKGTLEKAQELTGKIIRQAFVDKGYKKHDVETTEVFMTGSRKLSRSLRKALKRRSAIEPHIGHMKNDGKLGRNYLKGVLGDKLNALLTAVGHNLRLILNHIMHLFVCILVNLIAVLCALLFHKRKQSLITT